MAKTNHRAIAAHVLLMVLKDQAFLSQALATHGMSLNTQDQALVQAMCYGVLRYYYRLQALAKTYLSKPLKQKDQDVEILLLLGLYQLLEMRIPSHAAVAETVEATKVFGKSWASGLLNAILRQQIRDKKPMPEITLAHYEHPDWLINALKQAYGKDWQIIAQQNVLAPPMHIRINRQKVSREQYLNLLQQAGIVATASDLSPDGITLQQGIDVNHLPKFAEGWVSVQDLAAQMAAILLQTQAGQHVLDACAAPGGKTAHILEMVQCNMLALDVDPVRLQRVADNLTRLQLTATFKAADAAAVDSWWDGQLFDRILLDAPCSATGVIRRHPEIRLSRTAAEVQVAANIQQKLLQALWPTLKPGGILLYATCSVLPAENDQQIEQLLQAQTDAKIIPIELPVGRKTQYGWQFLPTENGPDGFYYAKLQKQP